MVFVASLVLFFTSSGFADEKIIKWKVQGFVPTGMLFHDTMVRLAEEVKNLTDGRLVWEVFPPGALVPPFEGVKAVSQGVYQVNYGNAGQWVGKIPVAPLFCSQPGGLNTVDLLMWLEHGGGMELYQEMYDTYGYNVKVFPGCPLPGEDFQWAKKPLRTLDDFKGVKMRMMPLMGDVLNKHGFAVVFMPSSEIMPNLQRGVIDSAEFSSAAFDKTLGIWEVCKYVMIPGLHQPSAAVEILINKDAYAALPDDLKVKLEAAIDKMRLKNWLWVEKQNLEAMEFFKEKGIEIVAMDPETINTMVKWAWEYLDERSEKDAFFGKVWNSQKAFAQRWNPYTKAYTLSH